MSELLDKIPMSYFWTGLVCFVLGMMATWRVARYVERMHDAVRHAKHHYERALDFVRYARNNIAGLALTVVVFAATLGVVGWLVVARVTG